MSLEFTPPVDTFSMADPGGILRPSWSEELRFGGALLWAEEMRALVAHPARLQRFGFSKYRTSFLLPHPNLCFSFGGVAALLRLTPPTSQFLHLKHIILTCVFRVLQPSPQLTGEHFHRSLKKPELSLWGPPGSASLAKHHAFEVRAAAAGVKASFRPVAERHSQRAAEWRGWFVSLHFVMDTRGDSTFWLL